MTKINFTEKSKLLLKEMGNCDEKEIKPNFFLSLDFSVGCQCLTIITMFLLMYFEILTFI